MQLLPSQQGPGGGRAPQQRQQQQRHALLLPAPSPVAAAAAQRRQQQPQQHSCTAAAADRCSWLAAAPTLLQQQPHRCPPLCSAALLAVHSSSSRRAQRQQQQNSWRCLASKAAAGGSQGSGKRRPPSDDMADVIMIEGDEGEEGEAGDEDEDDDDDEGFVDFEADDEDEFEEGDDEGAEYDDDDEGFEAGSDEDPGPEVLTGNVDWGDTALRVAEAVLAQPENTNLALYLFRVVVPTKVIEVRLDKLDDAYGSPGLEDIERFSRGLAQGLEAELGPKAAGDISFEVSSPGAERTLIIPTDLERFKDLPMRVEYMTEVGIIANPVLRFQALADGVTCWELADVKANQTFKGRGLTKKQRLTRYDIPVERLERVRIYVDF